MQMRSQQLKVQQQTSAPHLHAMHSLPAITERTRRFSSVHVRLLLLAYTFICTEIEAALCGNKINTSVKMMSPALICFQLYSDCRAQFYDQIELG